MIISKPQKKVWLLLYECLWVYQVFMNYGALYFRIERKLKVE